MVKQSIFLEVKMLIIMGMEKKVKLFIIIAFLLNTIVSVNAQVKIADNEDQTIDANSLLELESTTKGFLPPRVAIDSLTSVSPLSGSVPAGMLVYRDRKST